MRGLQEVLTRHGLTSNGQMVKLPDKIHAAYQHDQKQQRQEIATGLAELGQVIIEVATVVTQYLQTQAARQKRSKDDNDALS